MTPLWTIEAMASAMGAERHGALPQSISGISIDTRSIAKGEAQHREKRQGKGDHGSLWFSLIAYAAAALRIGTSPPGV